MYNRWLSHARYPHGSGKDPHQHCGCGLATKIKDGVKNAIDSYNKSKAENKELDRLGVRQESGKRRYDQAQVYKLTDKELRDLIERVKLENQYKELIDRQKSLSKGVIAKSIDKAIEQTAGDLLNKTTGKLVQMYSDKLFGKKASSDKQGNSNNQQAQQGTQNNGGNKKKKKNRNNNQNTN